MKNEILVIDDNSDIRFLISNILQENGYHVRTAANYDQAVSEIMAPLIRSTPKHCQSEP